MSKYGSVKTASGFPSKLESAVHDLLKIREKAGELKDIRRQQRVELQGGGKDLRIVWCIDFSCIRVSDGQTMYVEAKGIRLQDFVLKLKMFKKQKIAPLEIWSGDYRRPRLIEKFEPELGNIEHGA